MQESGGKRAGGDLAVIRFPLLQNLWGKLSNGRKMKLSFSI